MSLGVRDLAATIRATKQRLKAQIADRRKVFAEVEEDMRREVEGIRDARAQGLPVIPSVDYAKLRSGGVPEEVRQEIRRRGAVVVRGVFSGAQATAWNSAIGEYLARNRYYEQLADPSLDKYFSKLESGRPQIFGIYWSKPQMEARQHPALADHPVAGARHAQVVERQADRHAGHRDHAANHGLSQHTVHEGGQHAAMQE